MFYFTILLDHLFYFYAPHTKEKNYFIIKRNIKMHKMLQIKLSSYCGDSDCCVRPVAVLEVRAACNTLLQLIWTSTPPMKLWHSGKYCSTTWNHKCFLRLMTFQKENSIQSKWMKMLPAFKGWQALMSVWLLYHISSHVFLNSPLA